MKPLFEIPQPCHEDWQSMSQEEQGKFCGKCSHIVMDFSNHSNDEIVDFLKMKSGSRVCGRVRNDQLVKKSVTPSKSAKRYRLFIAALYFVFGGILFSSCGSSNAENDYVVGKMAPMEDTIRKADTIILESKPVFDSAKYLDSIKNAKPKKKTVSTKCPPPDMPDYKIGIMVMPEPPEVDTLK